MRARLHLLPLAIALLALLALPVARPLTAPEPGTTATAEAAGYGRLPLSFEANHGQTDESVQFLARGRGYTLFLTPGEAVLSLRPATPAAPADEPPAPTVLSLQLVGANAQATAVGEEPLPGVANYLLGNDPARWRTGVPTYAKVRYQDVYPGVDLVYYGNQGELEYDFIVAPGSDAAAISLSLGGADRLELDPAGDLLIHTAGGTLRQQRPFIYQEVGDRRVEIAGGHILLDTERVGFELGAYDPSRPLVIDPVLVYSTYLGGSGTDEGRSIAVDSVGQAYVTGHTESANFPTRNPLGPVLRGTNDVFVTKLNAAGTDLIFSTYLGGSGGDSGNGIALDSAANAYVTGATNSTDFPTTPGAFRTANGGRTDAFVVKLSATGAALGYSTYLGGSRDDVGLGIAVDSGGNAYIAGYTGSLDFPAQNTFQSVLADTHDAFVAKLNAQGTALVYSRYLGGSDDDRAYSIAVDGSGSAHVTGLTWSGNFPVMNAVQGLKGLTDAFVTKLTPQGDAFVYSTFLGGDPSGCFVPGGRDTGYAIALDSMGNAYIAGDTDSSNFGGPTNDIIWDYNPDERQNRCYIAGGDSFVAKLDSSGAGPRVRRLGGYVAHDGGRGVAVGTGGIVYMTGVTRAGNFPTSNAIQWANAGHNDAFVVKLDDNLTVLYSTYLGGADEDEGRAIAVTPDNYAYLTGITASTDLPRQGALQPAKGGGPDAFIAKLSPLVLGATPPHVASGASVTADFSDVPSPTGADWIGLYAANAPNTAVLSRRYTNGTTTPGSSAVSRGSVTIPVPSGLVPGNYELRLFRNDSYTLVASTPLIVNQATLSASPGTVATCGSVTATWGGVIPPSGGDWVGLYAPGAPDGSPITYLYTNGTTSPSGSGSAAGSTALTIPCGTAPGTHELRLFSNGTDSRLATATFSVVNPTATPTITPTPAPCAPRPNVGVSVAPSGPGRLQVTVSATATAGTPGNRLLELRFGAGTNAVLDLPDGRTGLASPVTVSPPAGTTSYSFYVRQVTTGSAATVPLTVVDTCGEWSTFVGGGPGALAPTPTPVPSGEVWQETERDWTGTWTQRGTTNTYDAVWTNASGGRVTAVLTISVQGANVTVQRRQTSDGNDCDYTGTLQADGRTVSGTYTCTSTGPAPWQATIQRGSAPSGGTLAQPSATATRAGSSGGTATPTPTPAALACTPRPNVAVATAPDAAGRLRVTLTAQGANNTLTALRFGTTTNALIDAGDQTGRTGDFSVALPAGTTQTSFTVRRATAGQGTTVPVTVVDACGDWPTVVGGGPTAF